MNTDIFLPFNQLAYKSPSSSSSILWIYLTLIHSEVLLTKHASRTGPPRSASVQGYSSPNKDGDTVALTCRVEADSMADISIEWLKDGELVALATECDYRFTGQASTSGKYSCRAKNSAGTVLSRSITVDMSEYNIINMRLVIVPSVNLNM